MNVLKFACSSIFLLATAGGASAANIAWGGPTDVTGNLSDFSTDGTFEFGWSGGNTGGPSIPITGVGTFSPGEQLQRGQYNSDSDNNWETVYPGADGGYTNLLEFAQWSNIGEKDTLSLPVSAGSIYQVQIWAADTRNCCSGDLVGGWEKTFGDGNGNNVTITGGNLDQTSLPNVAPQFVIGTFTADGTTQTIQMPNIGAGNSHPQYNALQVRLIPEPSGVALLGLGLAGFVLRRRRK